MDGCCDPAGAAEGCEAMGCRGNEEGAAADGTGDHASQADPTLMSCCEREEADRRAAAKLRRALLVRDPSARRQRAVETVVRMPPRDIDVEDASRLDGEDDEDESDFGSDLDDGGEEDEILVRMRLMRMAQLKASRESARKNLSSFRVEHVSEQEIEQRLMQLINDNERGSIVCFWAMHSGPTAEADACVLAQLEAMVATAREVVSDGGTTLAGFILLCVHQKHSHRPGRFLGRLGVPGVPAIVAFRDGVVVGKACGYEQFGGLDDLREERITGWLGTIGALPRAMNPLTRPDRQPRDREDDEADDDEDEEASDCRPCPECGRTYPHEHVRAVYSSAFNGGDDDDGSDSDDSMHDDSGAWQGVRR